jgi:hypothetical protein
MSSRESTAPAYRAALRSARGDVIERIGAPLAAAVLAALVQRRGRTRIWVRHPFASTPLFMCTHSSVLSATLPTNKPLLLTALRAAADWHVVGQAVSGKGALSTHENGAASHSG